MVRRAVSGAMGGMKRGFGLGAVGILGCALLLAGCGSSSEGFFGPPPSNGCVLSPQGTVAVAEFSGGDASSFCSDPGGGSLPGDIGMGTPAEASWGWDQLDQPADSYIHGSTITVRPSDGEPGLTLTVICSGTTLGNTYFAVYDSGNDYFSGNSGDTVGQVLCEGIPSS